VLFTEASGDPTGSNSNNVIRVRYNEAVYSQIRRFVVVSRRRGFCYAWYCTLRSISIAPTDTKSPIFTYGGKATTKPGVAPQAHAIIYTRGNKPKTLDDECALLKNRCIAVDPSPGSPPLTQASRLYFGIHHPIQHNVKVKDLGRVVLEDLAKLIGYWRKENAEFMPVQVDANALTERTAAGESRDVNAVDALSQHPATTAEMRVVRPNNVPDQLDSSMSIPSLPAVG